MGNLLLFVAIVVIVALIVHSADAQLKAELAAYTWERLLSGDPSGCLVALALRIQPGHEALAAADGLDLSPAQLVPNEAQPCVYCRTFVPHTRALCFATFDHYGLAELAPWAPITRELRSHLVAVSLDLPAVPA